MIHRPRDSLRVLVYAELLQNAQARIRVQVEVGNRIVVCGQSSRIMARQLRQSSIIGKVCNSSMPQAGQVFCRLEQHHAIAGYHAGSRRPERVVIDDDYGNRPVDSIQKVLSIMGHPQYPAYMISGYCGRIPLVVPAIRRENQMKPLLPLKAMQRRHHVPIDPVLRFQAPQYDFRGQQDNIAQVGRARVVPP